MAPRLPTLAPIALSATWVRNVWTTNPPKYEQHSRWTVEISISSQSHLRLALLVGGAADGNVIVTNERGHDFAFTVGPPRETEPTSTERADPWAALGVLATAAATTWSVIPVQSAREGAPETALMAFARHDTELLRNGRWRVRESLWPLLPVDSDVLRCGRRGGHWFVSSPVDAN